MATATAMAMAQAGPVIRPQAAWVGRWLGPAAGAVRWFGSGPTSQNLRFRKQRCLRPILAIYGHIWPYMDIYGHIWAIYGHVWSIYGHIWTIYAHIWSIYAHIWSIYGHIWSIYGHILIIYIAHVPVQITKGWPGTATCYANTLGIFYGKRVPIDRNIRWAYSKNPAG